MTDTPLTTEYINSMRDRLLCDKTLTGREIEKLCDAALKGVGPSNSAVDALVSSAYEDGFSQGFEACREHIKTDARRGAALQVPFEGGVPETDFEAGARGAYLGMVDFAERLTPNTDREDAMGVDDYSETRPEVLCATTPKQDGRDWLAKRLRTVLEPYLRMRFVKRADIEAQSAVYEALCETPATDREDYYQHNADKAAKMALGPNPTPHKEEDEIENFVEWLRRREKYDGYGGAFKRAADIIKSLREERDDYSKVVIKCRKECDDAYKDERAASANYVEAERRAFRYLNERDTLKAQVEKMREALRGLIWIVENNPGADCADVTNSTPMDDARKALSQTEGE